MPTRSKILDIGKAETELLIMLVEEGPMLDEYIPFRLAKNCLIKNGFAAEIVHKGVFGFTAATKCGAKHYLKLFGNSETVEEARQYRLKGQSRAA